MSLFQSFGFELSAISDLTCVSFLSSPSPALSCLSHLRELRLESNSITSIEGINQLPRLVALNLRGNQIQSFDASQTKWKRLLDLDLSHNSLSEVRALATLTSLRILNLDHNQLEELELESLPHLRSLRVCDNVALTSLDVLPAARLRTLYADFCSIQTIDNLEALTKLQDFSLRMQGVAGLIWPASRAQRRQTTLLLWKRFPWWTSERWTGTCSQYHSSSQVLQSGLLGVGELPADSLACRPSRAGTQHAHSECGSQPLRDFASSSEDA